MNHWQTTAPREGETETLVRSPIGPLTYRRDAQARLIGIRAAERTYLEPCDGWAVWGGGLLRSRERRSARGLEREVETQAARWRELYEWDEEGRVALVDGVALRRDAEGRVIACLPGGDDPAPDGHLWRYHYARGGLAGVDRPDGHRAIALGPRGRPRAWRGIDAGSCRYQGEERAIPPLPTRWRRDAAGRVWAEEDAAGRILRTWLWDGHRCLARLDGPLGAPLSAVFSLDPSGTPVRMTTAEGTLRLPRDAFGEGLTGIEGLPGLFGGMQHQGLVYLPWRALDPRLGAFCSPDPFDGSEVDPRRASGAFAGPLVVEPDPEAPYAIARHDPVGRADPTGAISGALIVSDFTWSWQNNLMTFFGIDWWFNLFMGLFTGFQLGNFASSRGLSSSDHIGAFAVRRDGFIAWMTGGRAFTTQHIVWAPESAFEELEQAMVLDPRGRYEPTLYGTLLRAEPDSQQPFLLRGMRDPGGGIAAAADWTRQGGTADFAAPDLPRPVFPEGGFHLDGGALAFSGNRACPLVELDPGPGLAVGTLELRATMTLLGGLTAPAVGDLALLEDGDGDRVLTPVVTSVADGALHLLRFADDAPAIADSGVTLTTFEAAPVSSEARGAEPAVANAFTAVGTATTYAAGDLLRLTSGNDVTVTRVDRLEARLTLNQPLPNGFAGPTVLTLMSVPASGTDALVVNATTLDFSATAAPAADTLGVVVGAATVPVRIVDASNAAAVTVDSAITAAGAAGATVSFRIPTTQNEIGRREGAAEAAAQVTYIPGRAGAAPDGSAGVVVLQAGGASGQVLRLVTGAAAYDAVVVQHAIAGAAPWTVERFRQKAGQPVLSGQSLTRAIAFASPDSASLDGADALRFMRVAATGTLPTPAAGAIAGMAVNGATATLNVAAGGPGAEPRPGQVVMVTSGGNARPAVLTRVRLTATLDRNLAGLPAALDGAVQLELVGPTYAAEQLGANSLALNPDVGGVAVDFPRFRAHEAVWVTHVPSGNTFQFSVEQVAGGRLDLDANSALPGAAGDALTVQRLLPADPANGHWLIGRNGALVANGPAQVAFDVWQPNAFPNTRTLGIIAGGRTWPAQVANVNQDLELIFAADLGLGAGAAADIAGMTVQASQDFPVFLREDQAILGLDNAPNLVTAAGQVAVAQAFVASDRRAANAELSPGTLTVPNEETLEIDRRQALVDHELSHTIQYSQWGPLWFCYFPILILELPVELATTTELPDYGPFVAGELKAEGTQWQLKPDARNQLQIQTDDRLQVVQGGNVQQVKVVSFDDEKIVVRRDDGAGAPPTGRVQVRRLNDAKAWDVVHSIIQFFTHGGLLNGLVGTTWGGILWLLAKGVYGIYRAIKGTGDLHAAQVENAGRQLRLTTTEGRQALSTAGRVNVKQGDSVVVRQATVADGVLTVTPAVSFTGEVKVALYDSHEPGSAFDWYDYRAGLVADTNNPFAVTVQGHGDDFAALDRVEVHYREQSFRTEVTARNGDILQLARAIPLASGETSLRIAKVGQNEAMGNADSYLMTEMGMGWMKWLFDPWGQFDRTVEFDNQWLNLIPRGLRYLFGTQMFSLLPVLGYVFYGRFFIAEHLAKIEQQASGQSGDLYTPLSRLTGEVRSTDNYAEYRMAVGDVARFRFWSIFREDSWVETTHQMEPGVHLTAEDLRLIVHRSATGASAEPNGTVESSAGPGNVPASAAADLFAAKPIANPTQLDPAITNPTGLVFTDLAQIPKSPTRVRSRSVYMAFTRPGAHRLTVANGIMAATAADGTPIDNMRKSREVQDRERQTILFNLDVVDAEVRIAGNAIAEGDTVQLVAMQRATLAVSVPGSAPVGPRRWRVTLRRPDQSDRLRRLGDLEIQARTAVGATAPVEVSRYYPFDAAQRRYSDGGLASFGLHLGGDVDIPVRRFTVSVVDTLPLRGSEDPAAAAAASLAQGAQGILLVPSPVVAPPSVTSFAGRAHNPGAGAGADPAFTLETITGPSAAIRAFIGSEGRAYRFSFAATPALAGSVPVVIGLTVGEAAPGPQVPLTCSFDLTP